VPEGATPAMTVDLDPLFSASPQDRAYDVYRELRENAPVMEVPGMGTWLISTYADVRAIVRDPGTWSSRYPERFGTGMTETSPPSARAEAALAKGYPWVPTLLFQDGREHRRHRTAVQHALSPQWVRGLEDTITRVARTLVESFPERGNVMFVRDFARALPGLVFAEAFGVDRADRERFMRWSQSIVNLGSPTDEERSIALAEEYVEFQHYVVSRIHDRRGRNGGDVLSRLVAPTLGANDNPGLSLPELVAICVLLLAAGTEPTTAALTSLLLRMIAQPELMATLCTDRARIPAAIDETLRLDSPVAMFQRKAALDTEIRGQKIRQGDMAMAIYASANRDPGHWEDPNEFRLDRPNIKDHLAFTHGPHNCVGAALARAIVRIAVEVLLERLETIELDRSRPLELLPDLMTRSYKELPLIVSKFGATGVVLPDLDA
jgi:cytochrome P450